LTHTVGLYVMYGFITDCAVAPVLC